MRGILFAFLIVISLAISAPAQVLIVTPARGFTVDYNGTGAVVVTLSATSNTQITAATILGQSIICTSTTGTTVTMNATDTAGNYLAKALSFTANSAPLSLVNSYAGIKLVGLNMWASAANAINCWITGKN